MEFHEKVNLRFRLWERIIILNTFGTLIGGMVLMMFFLFSKYRPEIFKDNTKRSFIVVKYSTILVFMNHNWW